MSKKHKNKSNNSTIQVSTKTGTPDEKQLHTINLYYSSLPAKKKIPDWNQSSSTWRHSAHRYSFSKGNRFISLRPSFLDIIQTQLPSSRSAKTCTFGKGRKMAIPDSVMRNAKEKPSPNSYNFEEFDEEPRKASKGKTFGLGWKSFEKVYINHRKDVYSSHFSRENPPSKYEVQKKPGEDKKSFSIYSKLKMYTQKMTDMKKDIPGASHLIKDRHLHNMTGLNERNFSFGKRLDLSAPANQFPGCEYEIKGFCDRFEKTHHKNVGSGG